MKSLLFKNLLSLAAFCSLVFLFSCGDEDPEDEAIGAPSLSVTASASTYTTDDTLAFNVTYAVPGEFGGFNYSWTATGETVVTFDKQFLTAAKVGVEETSTSGTFTFKPFNSKISDLNLKVDNEAYSLAGKSLTFKFEVSNKKDAQVDSTTVAVTVEEDIEVYGQLLFGAQGNAEPGFYGVLQNTRYNYGNARDKSSLVDFAYYWGDNDKNTIAAIDDGGLHLVYNSVSLPIEGIFGTRNATRFVKTDMSVDNYNDINTSSELETAAFFEVGGTSSATGLAKDNILAYKLSDARGGSFGLIKIVSVNDTNGNGTITIEVKAPVAAE